MKWHKHVLSCAMIVMLPAVAFGFPGSGGRPKESAAPAPEAKVEKAPAAPVEAPPQKKEPKEKVPTHVGKVVETMNGGGYSYVLLEKKGGEKHWYAIPESKLKAGDEVEIKLGMEMGQFTSRALNRTFESINFSGGLVVKDDDESLKKKAHAGIVSDDKAAGAEEAPIKVEKAAGANAYTVAEVYSKKSELSGKGIAVKGKVVKVSEGIMGKTWVHVRDGSGSSASGTHNLIATTQDVPAVGDTVTVTGDLALEKDFGSGYKYDVIVENAQIKK